MDEGDLAAVVRASGVSAAYKWQTPHAFINGDRVRRGSLITDLDTLPTPIAQSKSSDVLPNLSRNKSACMTAPGEMQAQLVNPYYDNNNGSLFMRYGSASASASALFESPKEYTAPSLRFFSSDAAAMCCDTERNNPRKNEGMNHGLVCGAASFEISRTPNVAEISSKKDETDSLTSPSTALLISKKAAQGSSASTSSLAPKIASSTSKSQAIKRRKTLQKRIVCVPAAVGSNKPNGEDVPSDHWAWRKYGQKPIKGSPYPRGYYRCSSSKGCLAKKQVERDRTDPNMVIMTYTSDHNHPWPTQRSSLAGSIRQTRCIKLEDACPNQEIAGSKPEENVDMLKARQAYTDSVLNGFTSIMEPSKAATTTREDAGAPINDERLFNIHDEDISGLQISISALLHNDDLFADLPEPMNMFSRQFVDDQSYDDDPDSTAVDPFNLFNWSTNGTTTPTTNTFGEDKTTM